MQTAIVGIGNVLMKDEGVGVHVARALKDLSLPEDVAVIDAGTCSDVAFDLETADRVIVVDAAHGGDPPGTIYRLTEGVTRERGEGLRSTHNVDLLHTLRDCGFKGRTPEVIVIGIEPKAIDWGLDLSPTVAACLPRVVEIVQEELRGCRCS
jgi:hydrogenase maturation protease